jgi:hypothetical protein
LSVEDKETGQEQEFFLDLLFYNYLLRRFVVIDLKTGVAFTEETPEALQPALPELPQLIAGCVARRISRAVGAAAGGLPRCALAGERPTGAARPHPTR